MRTKTIAYSIFSLLIVGVASALTVTKTWVTGETLTAADLNGAFTDVETAVTNLENGTTIPDSTTVTGWVMGASTATTPAADNNSTSLATTAYVQTELGAAGGRSISASGVGVLDADAELYTVTYSFPWLSSSIVATNDIVVDEIGTTFTPTRWACVANGGSGLTTIDASIEECNTNGAACAGIGATATVTAVDTTNADTSFTDTTLTAGNWFKFVFGTVTWTSPGTFTCTLRGTKND